MPDDLAESSGVPPDFGWDIPLLAPAISHKIGDQHTPRPDAIPMYLLTLLPGLSSKP